MENNLNINEKKKELSGFVKLLSEPLSKYGWPSWLVYALAILGGIYLLNPSFGLLELIPDNLPIIGNLDEGASVMMILAGIVQALEGRNSRAEQRKTQVVQEQPEQD
ncbi:MAG: hypothetical protein ACK2TV_02015 [Anaerolineales bacterium]|jgi:uncharacterized membrane protein YkvA (DUF1232 family)